MIVSAFISQLRRRYGDLPEKHLDVRQGDGSSTVYKAQFSPVVESSYGLYINNVLKTEGVASDYTLDLDTGDIVLAANTSNLIEFKYKSANFRDQWWLEAVQAGIRGMGDEFFRSVIRSTSGVTLSAGIQVYDCPSSCIRLTEAMQSDDYTSSGNFVPLGTNHWYDRRSNKLILGNKPNRANYMAISYLRRVNIPTATSATLDLEENWIEMLELKVGAIYARARALQIAQQGNVSVEEGHLSAQQLRQMANDNEALYQQMKRRNKPIMPSYAVPYYIHGGGNVLTP